MGAEAHFPPITEPAAVFLVLEAHWTRFPAHIAVEHLLNLAKAVVEGNQFLHILSVLSPEQTVAVVVDSVVVVDNFFLRIARALFLRQIVVGAADFVLAENFYILRDWNHNIFDILLVPCILRDLLVAASFARPDFQFLAQAEIFGIHRD